MEGNSSLVISLDMCYKIGMMRWRLAWPLHKDDTQIEKRSSFFESLLFSSWVSCKIFLVKGGRVCLRSESAIVSFEFLSGEATEVFVTL